MLDLHAVVVTPGAVLVLGTGDPTVAPGGDGQSSAGVPISGGATLVGWGLLAPTADSIARLKLTSQDQPDPINGVDIADGATSLKVGTFKNDNLPYESGMRKLSAGTNVGVVAGAGLLLDSYAHGPCVMGSRHMKGMVAPGTATTFGAALVANTWGSQPFAPANALPAGKYAILGAFASALTNVAALRFKHADFNGKTPGFPVVNANLTAALGIQLCDKTNLWIEQGMQFVTLGEDLGVPCCPVFTVSNLGTGLTIEAIAAQACTPVVSLLLAKVG